LFLHSAVQKYEFHIFIISKLILSLCGFFSFGFNTDEIVVNNFPAGTIHISVSASFVVGSLFSFILSLYPVFESLEESAFFSKITSSVSHVARDVIYRLSLVILTLAIALLLPHFALLTAFGFHLRRISK